MPCNFLNQQNSASIFRNWGIGDCAIYLHYDAYSERRGYARIGSKDLSNTIQERDSISPHTTRIFKIDSERECKCRVCGLIHDRDKNAAINILKVGGNDL